MRWSSIAVFAIIVLPTAVLHSQEESLSTKPVSGESSEVEIRVERQNPWTNLDFPNSTRNFQFAVVADGARSVEKLNLLQPEFVVSVGNQIERESESTEEWDKQWTEFESAIGRLQMPYFYCVGERDVPNAPLHEHWKRKFGRSYYSFRYQDVLFLILNTEDLPDEGSPFQIGTAQQRWVIEQLNNNRDALWTFVILHKPTWTFAKKEHHPGKLGWESIEDALQGRNYTVFAGHPGELARYERKEREYFHLAQRSRDAVAEEPAPEKLNHLLWVRMTDEGPEISDFTNDGVPSKDIRTLPNPKREK